MSPRGVPSLSPTPSPPPSSSRRRRPGPGASRPLVVLPAALLALACAGCASVTATTVVYDDEPSVLWTVESAVPSGLGRGNSVSVSPDGALVLVTSSSGSLRAVDAAEGSAGGGFTVNPRPLGEGYSVRCESGVGFAPPRGTLSDGGGGTWSANGSVEAQGEGGEGGYFVYAIVDVPPEGSGLAESSRVIAYNHPRTSQAPRWISPSLPGAASGTPAVSSDGKYVYLTHNAPNGTSALAGHFSVLSDAQMGAVLFTKGAEELGAPGPWAPVGIAHGPEEGNYLGGRLNANDVVAWGSLPGDNFNEGYVHGFQLPADFDGVDVTELEVRTFDDTSWSTLSAPAFGPGGYSLIFSASRSRMRGWTAGRRFNDNPNFAVDMSRADDDDPAPPPHGPTISADGGAVFSAAAAPKVYAFANDGDAAKLWERDLGSVAVGGVVASPDGSRVYVVESADGRAHGLDAADGTVLWTHAKRWGGVESLSDFAVSSDGTALYRGFKDGTVVALKLGTATTDPPAPTPAPTPNPAGPVPTPAPTYYWEAQPQASPRPTNYWETQPPAVAGPVPTPSPTYYWEKQPQASPRPTQPWERQPQISPRPTNYWEVQPQASPRPTNYWEIQPQASPRPTNWWEAQPQASPRPTQTWEVQPQASPRPTQTWERQPQATFRPTQPWERQPTLPPAPTISPKPTVSPRPTPGPTFYWERKTSDPTMAPTETFGGGAPSPVVGVRSGAAPSRMGADFLVAVALATMWVLLR